MTQWIDTVVATVTSTNLFIDGPKEGVFWNGKHSALDWKAYLGEDIDRKTPDEKGIYEDLPFTQGAEDFSMLYGERFFKMRTIVYPFIIPYVNKEERKGIQLNFENWLLGRGEGILLDDHDSGMFYTGKFIKVDTQDIEEYSMLIIKATFQAKPFKIGLVREGHHFIDEMNLAIDVFQKVFFEVSSERVIKLYNNSVTSIVPYFQVTGNLEIEIETDDVIVTVIADETSTRSEIFRLTVGMNYITLRGNGTIKFLWNKELI